MVLQDKYIFRSGADVPSGNPWYEGKLTSKHRNAAANPVWTSDAARKLPEFHTVFDTVMPSENQAQAKDEVPSPDEDEHNDSSRQSKDDQSRPQQSDSPWAILPRQRLLIIRERLTEAFEDSRSFIEAKFSSASEIPKRTLHTLTNLTSYLPAICIASALLIFLHDIAFHSIYHVQSPVCQVSMVRYLCHRPLPCANPYTGAEDRTDPVEELLKVYGRVESLLQATEETIALPDRITEGRLSTNTLLGRVSLSEVRSKDRLVRELEELIALGRKASYELARFDRDVGYCVDKIVYTTQDTKKVLIEISNFGSLDTFTNKIFLPLRPLLGTSLLDQYSQYRQHIKAVKLEIDSLVMKAPTLQTLLFDMENSLRMIGAIADKDGLGAQAAKKSTTGRLWTRLGGNQGGIAEIDEQLSVLSQVSAYRESAAHHVATTLEKLNGMSADLENLGSRVSDVDLLESNGAASLKQHIEMVGIGLENLEAARLRMRRSQIGHQRKTLGEEDSARMIDTN